jgi:hypothetical protein
MKTLVTLASSAAETQFNLRLCYDVVSKTKVIGYIVERDSNWGLSSVAIRGQSVTAILTFSVVQS